ncbi:hypothetical protein PAPYR_12103 [Paratrimastix pyriformis]|uniref:Uncharacterized protein n=1 Tax=Paratrimastix pyriformis TaxID=342808 RepID=A0ABQ8U649_9EUKA|nr:hypothetical protein PAPYR_12103 [Paratrimastix pyriformis]
MAPVLDLDPHSRGSAPALSAALVLILTRKSVPLKACECRMSASSSWWPRIGIMTPDMFGFGQIGVHWGSLVHEKNHVRVFPMPRELEGRAEYPIG